MSHHRGNPSGGRGSYHGSRDGTPGGRSKHYEQDSTPVIYDPGTPYQLPARLSAPNLARFAVDAKAAKTGPKRPIRPGFGTAGTAIKLRSNYFAIKIPNTTYHTYTVEVLETERIPQPVLIRIFEILEQHPLIAPYKTCIVHDSNQVLVSSKQLPQPFIVPIPFYQPPVTKPQIDSKVYKVKIIFSKSLHTTELKSYLAADRNYKDYDIQSHISALNTILQYYARRTAIKGRKGSSTYFSVSDRPMPLADGIEAWRGYFISVRPAFNELVLNVGVAFNAFTESGNLDKILQRVLKQYGNFNSMSRTLINSMRVRLLYNGHRKKLYEIGQRTARTEIFDSPDLGKVSVEAFFKRTHNITLQYPTELPVVNVGSASRPHWVPAELCEVEPGCLIKGKTSASVTANMIKCAAQKPAVSASAIVQRGFHTMGLSGEANYTLREFGISVEHKLTDLPGRELPPPVLVYGGNTNTMPRNGTWALDNKQFYRPGVVSTWCVLDTVGLDGHEGSSLRQLTSHFTGKLQATGIKFQKLAPLHIPVKLRSPIDDPGRKSSLNDIKQALRNNIQPNNKPSFVLVILGGVDNFIYPGIKKLCDMELGLITVCMLLNQALSNPGTNRQDMYLTNVALKVNIKLKGINHYFARPSSLHQPKTMMVGIDVTHPGPGSKPGAPSIAAVVANTGDDFVQFPASLKIQEGKKEILNFLVSMLAERLQAYYLTNRKTLPERIIVYRDGVSESQYDTVLEEELPQIIQSFETVRTAAGLKVYRPKVSIVICGKRHHTKFWPTQAEYADRNGNARAGTVVDQGVTGVYDNDFFLQAHSGMLGHIKSTHYVLIYDENNLTPDQIQVGTNDASYLFARCMKSVSLVPPAYYADLACERGRCYLNDFLVSSRGGPTEPNVYKAAEQAWGKGIHPDLRNTMFYI